MPTITTDTLPSQTQRRESRFRVDVELWGNDLLWVNDKKFAITAIGAGDFQDYNSRFITALEKIRSQINEDLTLSDADYQKCMKELRDIGIEAYKRLLSEEARKYIETLDKEEGERGLTLNFAFPATLELLLRMIYTGSPHDDPVDPEKFWGFRYPIAHHVEDADKRDKIILKSGIFASTHKELKYSLAELKNLEHLIDQIRQTEGYEVSVKRVDEAMACEELCSDDVLFKYFNREDFRYGVVHFACHCFNEEGNASKAYLELTANQTTLALTLGRFNALAGEYGFRNRPLVFLNACESLTPLHFLQSLNFPSSLINFGAGGVIATACAIPDEVASAFAADFYKSLLRESGTSIADTLMETSLHYVKTKKNPLGLAYGLYPTTDQRLKFE